MSELLQTQEHVPVKSRGTAKVHPAFGWADSSASLPIHPWYTYKKNLIFEDTLRALRAEFPGVDIVEPQCPPPRNEPLYVMPTTGVNKAPGLYFLASFFQGNAQMIKISKSPGGMF